MSRERERPRLPWGKWPEPGRGLGQVIKPHAPLPPPSPVPNLPVNCPACKGCGYSDIVESPAGAGTYDVVPCSACEGKRLVMPARAAEIRAELAARKSNP